MIEKILNKYGYVEVYLEYYQLDENAHFDSAGEYFFISDIWAHGSKRNKNKYYINYFLKKLVPLYPDVKYVYWIRHKYGNKKYKYILQKEGKFKLIKEK